MAPRTARTSSERFPASFAVEQPVLRMRSLIGWFNAPSDLARVISVVYADLRENCLAAAGHLPIVETHGNGPVGKRHGSSWPGRRGAAPALHGVCGQGILARFATGRMQPLREFVSHYGPRNRGQEDLRWRIWFARMAVRHFGL